MPPTRIPAIGASSDLTGAILNDTYAVEALLGHGGMGAVYRARHTRTGRAYAVKVLLPDARRSLHGIERFKREASAVSALGHEGIVSVHDFHQTTDGVHYLVMDLLSGETLGQHLAREGTLPWPVARRIALEVASALQAAHDAGVVHRDLKPHNVFLARRSAGEPRAVLLDFGLAKPMEDVALTESGVPVGTPLYMSPEQARGEPVDARTDVYALGTLVYEMLSGAPPFSEAVLARVYARLLDEPAPPVSRAAVRPCPSGLDEILTRALAKDREARYASAAELAADLLALPSL